MHCKRIFYVALALITLIQAASGQPAEKEQPPRATRFQALVQVRADPDSGLADRHILVMLGSDESLLAKAIAKVSPEAAKRAGAINEVSLEIGDYPRSDRDGAPSIPGVARLLVTLRPLEGVPAGKLLSAWMDCLQEKLRDIDVGHQADEERVDYLTQLVQSVAKQLEDQRRAYHAIAQLHQMPKNADVAAQREAQLELQRQTMLIELQGLSARQKLLEEQLATMGAKVKEEAEKEPVVIELTKALEIQKRLAAIRKAAAGRKREPVEAIQELEAQAELAKHQAELSKFRREAMQSAGGGRMTDLKRRLEDTAIEIAETKAKLEVVAELESAIGWSPQVDQKRLDVENLEREYRAATEELSLLRRKLRLHQWPQVRPMSSPDNSDAAAPEGPADPKAPQPAKDEPKPANPPEKPAPPAK